MLIFHGLFNVFYGELNKIHGLFHISYSKYTISLKKLLIFHSLFNVFYWELHKIHGKITYKLLTFHGELHINLDKYP